MCLPPNSARFMSSTSSHGTAIPQSEKRAPHNFRNTFYTPWKRYSQLRNIANIESSARFTNSYSGWSTRIYMGSDKCSWASCWFPTVAAMGVQMLLYRRGYYCDLAFIAPGPSILTLVWSSSFRLNQYSLLLLPAYLGMT